MRRICALAGLVVCMALPAPLHAAPPSGYRPIGPPATLGSIAFAADGTVYGSVGAVRFTAVDSAWTEPDPPRDPRLVPGDAVWRSTDHGRTWSARYRPAPGMHLAILAVSPADPATVFASEDAPGSGLRVERIDVSTGSAEPLPLQHLLGIDAAGTAYGITAQGAGDSLMRCPQAAACDSVAIPRFLNHAIAVDPKSADVLAAVTGRDGAHRITLSSDGGASWVAGLGLDGDTNCDCSELAFAGPGPRTLFGVSERSLLISHDAGLTRSDMRPVPGFSSLVAGSQPAATFLGRGQSSDSRVLAITADEGASFASLPLPEPGAPLAVDPLDARHLFLVQDGRTTQSWDAGASWSDVGDSRFGAAPPAPGRIAAAGSRIYSVSRRAVWISPDLGVTWSRVQPPSERFQYVVVSRDDPLTAYALTNYPAFANVRTRDGGATWETFAGNVSGIVPGDAAHLFTRGLQSFDAGATWVPLPADRDCTWLTAKPDAASRTGQRLSCTPYYGGLESRPLSVPPQVSTPGVFGAPRSPGVFALAYGDLLGDLAADGSWRSLLPSTRRIGPSVGARGASAWPSAGGTTFIAVDGRVTWARRGAGRWWRLQIAGNDVVPVAQLDRTHELVTPSGSADHPYDGGLPLAVLDLARPIVDAPVVERRGDELLCAVAWSSDAATAAYRWERNGNRLRGATRGHYRPSRIGGRRRFTCTATARTDWGSSSLSATNSVSVR
jgi:photosystem II stability/assembly factor-like uncharacterized protein